MPQVKKTERGPCGPGQRTLASRPHSRKGERTSRVFGVVTVERADSVSLSHKQQSYVSPLNCVPHMITRMAVKTRQRIHLREVKSYKSSSSPYRGRHPNAAAVALAFLLFHATFASSSLPCHTPIAHQPGMEALPAGFARLPKQHRLTYARA